MSSDNKNSKKNIDENVTKESFLSKMKNDKKYNAKVQLIGYGIFIAALVVYLNLSSLSSGSKSNLKLEDFNKNNLTNNNEVVEKKNLLDSLGNNYSYNIIIDVDKKSINANTNEEEVLEYSINYFGKSYDNKLEISKKINETTEVYYKLDKEYYNMVNDETSIVQENVIYDIIDSDYIELDAIMEFINKASLDHVTDYSSGKKVSVYHYEVLSAMSNNRETDFVEINVTEENGVLKIEIDYDNLFKEIDNSVLDCDLVATITNIGLVDDFEVVVNEGENTSVE